GDLVISVDTADRQAQDRGHALRDELRILMVHGLLHLLGYDHETSQEDLLEMAEAEGRLMDKLDWQGSGLIERVTGPST
ncbi:MAG: rRNA maturation RNase YbeY, partial [Cognaticolwellia sp.]